MLAGSPTLSSPRVCSSPRASNPRPDMADETETTQRDWRDTVFLPKTDFPMKAGLAAKEPAILAKWEADDLYGTLRKQRAGPRALHPPRRPALRQWRHPHGPRA